MTESNDVATATVDNVIVDGEPYLELTVGEPGEEFLMAPEDEDEMPAPEAPVEIDYDGMAIKVALGLKQVHQMGDNVAFMLVHPTVFEGLTAALHAMPDEAFPALFKEQLGIFPDENANPVRIITQTDLEGEFLQQYFTANGLLPRIQHYMQNSTTKLRIGGAEQEIPNPVRVTLETLRVLFVLDLKERLAPGIIRPPMGAQVVQDMLRK